MLLVGPAAQTSQAIRLILNRLSDRSVMPIGFAASGATPEMLRQEVGQAHATRRSPDTDLLLVVAQADRLSPDLLHELEMAAEAAATHGGLKFLFAAPRDLSASLQRAELWSLAACVRTCLSVPPPRPANPPSEQPGRDAAGRADGRPYPFDLLLEPLSVARHAQQAGPAPRIMLAVGILVALGLALAGVLVEHQPNRPVLPPAPSAPALTAPDSSLPGPPASAPPVAAPPVDSFETAAPPTASEPAAVPPAPAPSATPAPIPSAPSSSPPASVSASPPPVPTQQPADVPPAVSAAHSPETLAPKTLAPEPPAPPAAAEPAAVPSPPASPAPAATAASAPPPTPVPAPPASTVPPQPTGVPVAVPAGPTPPPASPPPGGIGTAGIVPQMAPAPHASLLLLAGPADTLSSLYAQVYRGTTPPPYAQVVTLNPVVRSGVRLVFPAPPAGWPAASPP